MYDDEFIKLACIQGHNSKGKHIQNLNITKGAGTIASGETSYLMQAILLSLRYILIKMPPLSLSILQHVRVFNTCSRNIVLAKSLPPVVSMSTTNENCGNVTYCDWLPCQLMQGIGPLSKKNKGPEKRSNFQFK